MTRKVRLLLATVTAVVGFLLAGCGSNSEPPAQNPSADLNSFYSQQVNWKSCGSDANQMCASIKVPLNYSDLSQGDIEIAVARTKRSGGNKTETNGGSILTNPGGPGASGLDFHPYMVGMLGDDVLANYDVVSFDPRGVGKSASVTCLDTKQMDTFMADLGTPNKVTSVDQVSAAAASMGAGCEKGSARVLPYVGTNNTARDMDVIRGVLGETKISYYGASYGSSLGQIFATLFPDKTGRFVLDGVVPMWFDIEQMGLGQAKGFETTFERFVANCPKHRGCPLPNNPQQATSKVKNLLNQLGSKNLPAKGDDSGREVTQAIAYNGVMASMYDDSYGWADLRRALAQAFAGNGTGLLQLSDEYAERENGKYGGILQSYYAISCLDQDGRADVTATEQLGKEWAGQAPMFGDYMAWTGLPCSNWPAPVDLAPSRDNWSGLPAMLLINYSEDPATPYEWAEEVASSMPQSALVKVPGPNHVAAFNEIKCVDDSISQFYLDGKLPASRATCPAK
ncbi:MAG: alpha/beta hydrolase [Candidatus Nanopelagicales bacterium]